tara:strand:+ start:296 stop:595 length:300 start_codon:yes stop_codon:yes gene_type:complete
MKMIKRLSHLLPVLTMGVITTTIYSPPANAEDWRVNECEADNDNGGNPVIVCNDGFSIAVFWNDGSYVNGWCNSRNDYDVDYRGLSRENAQSWVRYICN